jgi:transcriptional regulator
MFVRPCWRPRSEAEMLDFIDRNSWALLVTNGEDGPFATNLPMILDRSGDRPKLVSHLARANDHARQLLNSTVPSLVIFEGPASYVTASWYPNRQMPSTYYYTAVHCYGMVQMQQTATLRESLEVLTRHHETPLQDGWRTTEIPESEITRRLPAILGFEIEINRIEGKFKLGQDEPKLDALAVAERLFERNAAGDKEFALLVRSYNESRKD